MVGDGYKIQGSGICKGVKMELQGYNIQQDFYLFDLGEADMALGYEWLDSLGETLVNWHQHMMKINTGGTVIC